MAVSDEADYLKVLYDLSAPWVRLRLIRVTDPAVNPRHLWSEAEAADYQALMDRLG